MKTEIAKAARQVHPADVLGWYNIPLGADYHALDSRQVDGLLAWADECRYRKPRNANGSRARYFHAYLQRRAAKRGK